MVSVEMNQLDILDLLKLGTPQLGCCYTSSWYLVLYVFLPSELLQLFDCNAVLVAVAMNIHAAHYNYGQLLLN